MTTLLANLGMIVGLLMAVAGAATVLVTGLDPLYSAIGIVVAVIGGGLAWYGNRLGGGGGEKSSQDPERSRQAPEKSVQKKGHTSQMNRRL